MPTTATPKETSIKVRGVLRARPSSCVGDGGKRGLIARFIDIDKLFSNGFTAQWLGPDAAHFLDTHLQELNAGRCLELELVNLHAANQELRARVKTCVLLPPPPSWAKKAESATATPAPTTPQPESQHNE